jgi:hypothetical protein
MEIHASATCPFDRFIIQQERAGFDGQFLPAAVDFELDKFFFHERLLQ